MKYDKKNHMRFQAILGKRGKGEYKTKDTNA